MLPSNFAFSFGHEKIYYVDGHRTISLPAEGSEELSTL